MTGHSTGRRREGVERVDALSDLGHATMTVAEHTLDPAGIGQPSPHHPRDLLSSRASLGRRWRAGIEVVEFYIIAEQCRRRRKAADEIGNPVAIEKIALAVVLRVDQRIGQGYAGTEAIPRRHGRLRATVGMGYGGEIGLAEIFTRSPGTVERERRCSRA